MDGVRCSATLQKVGVFGDGGAGASGVPLRSVSVIPKQMLTLGQWFLAFLVLSPFTAVP